ncbi:hypothetical protein B296_00040382 [Ensete ventricosum]|uniref:Uncharacterized protein n=1 Tax=Ensete ventricosum TaxID=4639 RepID=A0A426ZM02_ENSVE|nr:hypothetical protein B296_00040382 [Ensete ventricosum]
MAATMAGDGEGCSKGQRLRQRVATATGDKEEEICLLMAAGGSGRRRCGWVARSSGMATQEAEDGGDDIGNGRCNR